MLKLTITAIATNEKTGKVEHDQTNNFYGLAADELQEMQTEYLELLEKFNSTTADTLG